MNGHASVNEGGRTDSRSPRWALCACWFSTDMGAQEVADKSMLQSFAGPRAGSIEPSPVGQRRQTCCHTLVWNRFVRQAFAAFVDTVHDELTRCYGQDLYVFRPQFIRPRSQSRIGKLSRQLFPTRETAKIGAHFAAHRCQNCRYWSCPVASIKRVFPH